MVIETRKTATGTEYWDTEKQAAQFEVFDEGKPDLTDMKLHELLAYAKAKGLVIPKGTTKRADVIKFIEVND
ncbi:hypothetical protein FD13_GL001041 [Levilactobacillus senmaizukei DSM 21775 = NBRC 103853]|uniref:Rho termination factor N-terminal domain-containing protein n=1 Tax=Levilactobacillus senmaizukei DSM 21775 = NBRC 103853 TaxID=1423803 RepID=A0A0R2DLA7_9LACO|nr:hypothetical protein [Levilactobacillus senmaizukei]KRN01447.1 hypothetical protein FD13_GL001041 [Levilactobacillus senmaizukei DSM 21775 = NBRC 103853]